jgi:hypothetical protein
MPSASASTLALGQSSYELLDIDQNDVKDIAENVSVSQRGSSALISNTEPGGTPVENFSIGIGSDLSDYNNDFIDQSANNNISVRGDFNNFSAYTGEGRDALSLSGNLTNAEIVLDAQNVGGESGSQFNDRLDIRGDLLSSYPNDPDVRNEIWTGGGNDTVRISGIVNDANIALGTGNDSLLVGGSSERLYVSGDAGRDFIELRGSADDAIIQAGDDNDTVVLRGNLYGTGFSSISESDKSAAVDLGAGNDSLVMQDGSYFAQINTGSGLDTLRLTGTFESTDFHLDGLDSLAQPGSNAGGDLLTLSAGTVFDDVSLTSSNLDGDTMIVGAGSLFADSSFVFGAGADSLVFGSGFGDFDSLLDLGEGADTVVFGSGSVLDGTTIDLGGDTDADLIRFATFEELEFVTIEGASDNDVLFIGYNEYRYGADDSITLSASSGYDEDWMDGWAKA